MFLRAARNAGFEVPEDAIYEAMRFVEQCFEPEQGAFWYTANPNAPNNHLNQGMNGAGILMLALGGKHDSPIAQRAGNWLMENPISTEDRFYDYAAYYCAQAYVQLGEPYWTFGFRPLLNMLLDEQLDNGAWPASTVAHYYGDLYTTSLVTLALGAPLQLMPIYQR